MKVTGALRYDIPTAAVEVAIEVEKNIVGVVTPRAKRPSVIERAIYLLARVPFGTSKKRLRLFLLLEWMFRRLSYEESGNFIEDAYQPNVLNTQHFILPLLQSNFSVLDVGCASGVHSQFIARHVTSVIGIDYSSQMITSCKNRSIRSNVEYQLVEAESFLRSGDSKFDLIVLGHILEHLDDPLQFLMLVVSRCNYAYIEVPDFDYCVTNRYRQMVGSRFLYSDNDHRYEWDRVEMADLLDRSGMIIKEEEFRHGVMRYWCATSESIASS